jgi:hypothetical protein
MTPTDPPDPRASRKYVMTNRWLVINSAVMAASVYLAATGKLTGDWTTLCSAFFIASAGAVAAYIGGNAYTTGKGGDAS